MHPIAKGASGDVDGRDVSFCKQGNIEIWTANLAHKADDVRKAHIFGTETSSLGENGKRP